MHFSNETLSGRYRLGTRVSEGAAGETYLATDTELDRPVRIRVPSSAALAKPGFQDRLAAGIKALGGLRHPALAGIQGRGEHGGIPYVVLADPGAGSLAERIANAPGGCLPLDDVLTWLPTVAQAVDFLHLEELVHGSISPARILFDEHDHPYVDIPGIDAVLADAAGGAASLDAAWGAPDYMAPELLADATVGPAIDVYALGTILYACLSGRLPFETGSTMSVAVKKNATEPLSLQAAAPGIPAAVATVVMRALARDPDARPVTAKNLAFRLERAAQGDGSAAPPPRIAASPAPQSPDAARSPARTPAASASARGPGRAAASPGPGRSKRSAHPGRASAPAAARTAPPKARARRSATIAPGAKGTPRLGRVLGVGAVLVLLVASAAFAAWPREARDLYRGLVDDTAAPTSGSREIAEAPTPGPRPIADSPATPGISPVVPVAPGTPGMSPVVPVAPGTPGMSPVVPVVPVVPAGPAPTPAPATPAVVDPHLAQFTFLRRESFSQGGASHSMAIYRHNALAKALGYQGGDSSPDVEFVLIPAGSFTMGSPDLEIGRESVEGPRSVTRIPEFMLARTETSQRVWAVLAGPANLVANPSLTKRGLAPVDRVLWDEAWNAARTIGLRLPTESEWEYACRAGTTSAFTFGANITPAQVNFNGAQPYAGAAPGQNRGSVVDVGSLPANAFGLHEVHGNVSEWCQDSWQYDLTRPPGDGKPSVIPWRLSMRPQRGGTWAQGAVDARSAQRRMPKFHVEQRTDNVGMRLAMSIGERSDNAEEERAYLVASRIAHFRLEVNAEDILGGQRAMLHHGVTWERPPPGTGDRHAMLLRGDQGSVYSAQAEVSTLRYASFAVALDFLPLSFPPEATILVGGPSYRWLSVGCNAGQKLVLTLNNGRLPTVFEDAHVEKGAFHSIIVSVDLAAKRVLAMFDGKPLAPITLPEDFKLNVFGTPAEATERKFAFSNGANGGVFHGYVRDLRVYGRAMSAKEMRALSFLLSHQ